MTTQQFLDGIAVVNFVPTPLVMFVTWCVTAHGDARCVLRNTCARLVRGKADIVTALDERRDGFVAGGVAGAILMTIGMCVPRPCVSCCVGVHPLGSA